MTDRFENLAKHVNLLYEAKNNMCKHYGQLPIKFSAHTTGDSLQNTFKFVPNCRELYIWTNVDGEPSKELNDFEYNIENGNQFLTPGQLGMPDSDKFTEMYFTVSCESGELGELLNFASDGYKITGKDCVVNQCLHKFYQAKLNNIDNVYDAIDLAFDIFMS